MNEEFNRKIMVGENIHQPSECSEMINFFLNIFLLWMNCQ